MALGYRIGVAGRHANTPPEMSSAEIMAAYEACGSDHIDIVCLPPGADVDAIG